MSETLLKTIVLPDELRPLLFDIQARRNGAVRQRWERWLQSTPAMLHSIDGEGRLVAVSDAWLARLGYRRDEVIGVRSTRFLTPESRAYAIATVLPAFFRDGRCENIEYQMVCKDGTVIDVLLSAILKKGAMGQAGTSLTVITDVTDRKLAERRLAESEERYRGLVEDQTDLVSLATRCGELLFVNHAYARLHGLQPADMVGRNLLDFVPDGNRAAVARHLADVVARPNQSVEDENQIRLPDGGTRWIAWTNRALPGAAGEPTVIHSVGRDIDRRVAAEQRLKESEARYRLLAEHGTDMVFHLDRDLVRRYVSPACREVLGYEPEEMLGIKPVSMIHPEDAGRVGGVLRSLLSGAAERCSCVNRIRHRDGRWIWVEAQFRALRDARGTVQGIIGALRDISARKAVEDQLAEANRRLAALAGEDALTGLANRRTFDDTLAHEHARALRERTGLAVVMLDVDFFKAYNDGYGHPAGDECLRRIAALIAEAARRSNGVAARYGGEEFALVLPGTDEAGAACIADGIRHAVVAAALLHRGSPRGVVTVSVGVAAAAGRSLRNGREALLLGADRALYRAKLNGRNGMCRASEGRPPRSPRVA